MGRLPLANKSLGQHFLNSPKVISKITTPVPEGTEAIVEVGPGPAVLTPHLKAHGLPVYVIEMDERFVELLAPVVGSENVYRQDALLFDWQKFIMEKKLTSIWLVSNLPYNVSVPLTLSFLRIPEIKNMTLMYQKEVAQKFSPTDPRNSMSSLHALSRTQFDISHVVHAPPGAFIPPPKVDSQVIHFKRKALPSIELQKIDPFEVFLRVVFSQRRKQLGGIMRNEWGSEVTQATLEVAGLTPTIRAEAISFEEVLKLYEAYSQASLKSV